MIYCAGLIALICGCGTSVEELPSAIDSLDLVNKVSRPTVVEQTNDVNQRYRRYATALGYSLYFWHTSDAAYIFPKKNREAFDQLLRKNMFVAAGQLMGIGVLARQGGVLLGRHALPLMVDGQSINFKALTPMRGLIIVAAPQSGLLKESSTWALSDLIMAAADHPVICKLEQRVADNVKSCLAHQVTSPALLIGSILLSQTLWGDHLRFCLPIAPERWAHLRR